MRTLSGVPSQSQPWIWVAVLVLALLGLVPTLAQNTTLSPLGITVVGSTTFLTDSPASLRVVVFNHQLQKPVADALVSLRLSGAGGAARLLVGRTDERGTLEASFRIPALDPGEYTLTVSAVSGGFREETEQKVRLTRGYRVLLTTDKPLYQPGQVMHLRALALRRPDLKAVSGEPLTIEVSDAKGNKVFKRTLKTTAFGLAFTDFQLADEVNMGRYTVRAILADQPTEKTVTVQRYVLPKFKVTLTPDRSFYLPGSRVEGKLQADYFFGKPVAGAQVSIVVKTFDVEYTDIARLEGKTDAEGAYRFDLTLPPQFVGQPLEQGQAFLQFDAQVTDTAEHQESVTKTSTVAAAPLTINAVPEAGEIIPGQENQVFLLVSSPDGKPLPATVTVLSAQTQGDTEIAVADKTLTTDALGVATLRLRPAAPTADADRWGGWSPPLVLKLRAVTAAGDSLEREISLDSRPQPGGSLLLRADRALYSVGDQLTATIYSSPTSGTVYFDLIKDQQTMLTRAAEVHDGQARITLPLTPELSGTVYLSAYRIMPDNNIVRDTRPLFVEPASDLQIKIGADQSTYLPGKPARLAFTVTNSEGAPVAAALGINVVDESVFALQELQPGMEKVYFYLEQELLKPRYEIHTVELPTLISAPLPGPGPIVPLAEDAPRQQAARLVFAAATLPELPSFFVNTYTDRLAKARQEWTKALQPIVEHIQKALEAYRNDHDGNPPTTEQGVSELLRTGYLKAPDLMDPWGNRLKVSPAPGQGDRMYQAVVFSLGPDAKPDTEDDLYVYTYNPDYAFATADDARQGRWGRGGGGFAGGIMFDKGALGAQGPAGAAGAPMPMAAPAGPGVPPVAFNSGVVTATPALPAKETVRVRQFFPETMFTEPALITGADGKATLTVPMADSITTWRLTALANSAAGQLGSTTAGLRCFQDFFIDLDLPVALTAGDQVSVPVAIYNYLAEPQKVRLEITPADWFDLKSEPTVEMEVAPNNVSVKYFTIVARRLGDHQLTVHALGAKMSDAITRDIRIEPDGKRIEAAVSDRLEGTVQKTITFPAGALPDASRLFVKIYPGIFSTLVEGLDAILQMPYGCFEQTSSSTYPNVLALDYMKTVGKTTPEVQMKAEGFINTGYQRLVSFEVPGGGFSWFGNAPANQLLTAYGLMEFHDMARVHPVDENLISRTQDWLVQQQLPSGAWKRDAEYIDEGHWSRLQLPDLPPTAYVAWGLAASGYKGPALDRALGYLLENRKLAKDPYVLALLANALVSTDNALHGGKLAATTVEVLDSLRALAKRENGKMWWETEMTGFTHSSGAQADLETTGMAAVAFVTSGQDPAVTGEILNYLLANKDPRGTWGSTQATVLALRALVLSVGAATTKVSGTVDVLVNGQPVGKHQLTPENTDVVWQVDCRPQLKTGANQVELRFAGEGTTLYQIVSRYYLPWERIAQPQQEALSIKLDYDKTKLATNDEVTATATVQNNLSGAAGMVVVDLGIPPGFTPNYEDLDALVKAGRISKYNPTSRQIIVYLEKLGAGQKLQFSYRLKARFPIRAQTPVTTAYEYYNPDHRAEAAPRLLEVE